MRDYTSINVESVKAGDVILSNDNSRWTVDEVRKLGDRYELLTHNGQRNQRYYLKSGDKVRKTR